jgi:pyruvate decarboxylase
MFYSSIGFTVGATLGSLVARKELQIQGRCLLFVGDGSLQMTVQEISTIIHNGFTPTIFVINNKGYTIERVIHGPSRKYNDIDPWNYQLMLQFFGASASAKSYRAERYEDILSIVADKDFQNSTRIQVVECVLEKYDSPRLLSDLVDGSQARATVALKAEDDHNSRQRHGLDGTLTDSGLSAGL